MRENRIGLWIVAGMAAMVIAGCAQPPLEDKNAADDARKTALTTQAEVYAAEAMSEARKLWDDAEAKMQSKAYPEAKAAYVSAKAAFEKAAGEVEAGKAAVVEENKAVLASVKESWKELGKLAGKKIKKLQADMKNSWEEDSKTIQDAVKKAEEDANPAEIKGALAEAKNLVEKWLGTFKK